MTNRVPQHWSHAGSNVAAIADRRTLYRLWAACLLGGIGQSVVGPAGSLLARQFGGSSAWAGLPSTVVVAGAAASAVALMRLTLRWGRGRALSIGAAAAVLGCTTVVVAATRSSLWMVLAGSLLLGSGTTAVSLARYAAADLGTEGARARLMATALTATTIGAVAGPNLLSPTARLAEACGLPPLSGPYIVAAVAFGLAVVAFADPRQRRSTSVVTVGSAVACNTPSRGLPATSRVGITVLTLGGVVMVGVMSMTPVQMSNGMLMSAGADSLRAIGFVVSAHVAGMFAPSPLTGRLVQTIGAAWTAAIGGVVLAASCLSAIQATSVSAMGASMIGLGVGWNFSLISGSALLTTHLTSEQRPRREAVGEVRMNIVAAGGGLASGTIMAAGGYAAVDVCGCGIAVLLPVLIVAGALRRWDRVDNFVVQPMGDEVRAHEDGVSAQSGDYSTGAGGR